MGVADSTRDYFERNTPEYSTARYDPIVEVVRSLTTNDTSLLDIGCATGNILAALRERTGLERMYGADISPANVEKVRGRGFEAFECDVLESSSLAVLPGPFDVVIVGAVLHHLVGRTRRASRRLAERGLQNAASLVKSGGHLLIMEPTFEPSASMTLLFHVKRVVGGLSGGRRVMLGGYWNNLGAPVVSYYSHDDVTGFARDGCGCTIDDVLVRDKPVSRAWSLAGVTRRSDTIVVACVQER